jgi:hypothetical protein
MLGRKEQKMSPEQREGYDAYYKGRGIGSNPFVWSNETWWMFEDWEKGWREAEAEDAANADDDYDY